LRQAQVIRTSIRPGILQHPVYTTVEQKVCLRGVAAYREAGTDRRFGHRSEIDMRRDVLQTGPEQRIVMCPVPVMTQQRTAGALRMVILATWISVISE
jgi:hypothetical protein